MKLQLAHKLKSEQGASMLFALFAFFLAAMVATVIIVAAATTVKQNKDEFTDKQGIIALQDAGQLVSEGMQGSTYIITETTTTDAGSGTSNTDRNEEVTGLFGSMLKKAIDNKEYTGTFTVSAKVQSVPGDASSEEDISIDVSYEMQSSTYQVNFTLTHPSTDQVMYEANVCNYDHSTTTDTMAGVTTTKVVTTYKWNYGTFGTDKGSVFGIAG